MTFTLGPQQLARCPGAALGLFRGEESQRLNSSQQVGLLHFIWLSAHPGSCLLQQLDSIGLI